MPHMTAATQLKATTVRRNTKRYDAVLTTSSKYLCSSHNNQYRAVEVDVEWARRELIGQARDVKAKMVDNKNGTFTVSFHSRRWYTITP